MEGYLVKKALVVPKKAKKAIAVRAGKAVLEQLPVDQKKLKVAAALLERVDLKRLGVVAVSGAAAISLAGSALQARMTRTALRRELKRQLAPVNKKLDELEKQNAELQRQNDELRKQLKKGS